MGAGASVVAHIGIEKFAVTEASMEAAASETSTAFNRTSELSVDAIDIPYTKILPWQRNLSALGLDDSLIKRAR